MLFAQSNVSKVLESFFLFLEPQLSISLELCLFKVSNIIVMSKFSIHYAPIYIPFKKNSVLEIIGSFKNKTPHNIFKISNIITLLVVPWFHSWDSQSKYYPSIIHVELSPCFENTIFFIAKFAILKSLCLSHCESKWLHENYCIFIQNSQVQLFVYLKMI
jgi:hypothetical protein